MIYDVLADFNAGDVKYNKDTTDPRVPIDSLSQFYNNKIKIETTKIKDIEKALSEYSTMTDEVLGIEVHNEDQYKRMKDLRMKYNITDDIYPTDIKDLSNTAKLTQAKSKLKRYVGSPEMKMIFDEQKKGNDFRAKAVEIMSMNEPLGILAMKDYLEKYGNKSEKSYTGFDLNINDYVPMDVDDEIAKMAKDIEREYFLEKDLTSPTDLGYMFINKNSRVTENGREIFERKINALRSNKRFDNNMKSYLALNSPETDYNDPNAYNDFMSEMMERHLGDKVVDVETKKIDTKIVQGAGGGSSSSGSGGSSSSSYGLNDDSLKTEGERNARRTRMALEEREDLKDYDFSSIEVMIPEGTRLKEVRDEMTGAGGSFEKTPTGRKVAVFTSKEGKDIEIPLNKVPQGQKRKTLADMEMEANMPAQQQQLTPQQIAAQKEDVTINNPERAKYVSGLKKGEGKYLEDGTWVQNTVSGKIPVVSDAVNLQREGLNVKVGVGQPAENYHLTRSTTNKAKEFVAGIGDYMITESGTDTISKGHSNKKHYDGTAFDMSLQGEDSRDIDRLFNVMLEAKKAGLDAQYESKEKSVVDALNERIQVWNVQNKKNKLKPAANWPYAPHFSVYDNDPFIPVKSGQVPALDIASPKKNEDYYNFVQSNQLDKRPMQDVVQLNTTYLQTKHKPVYEALKESDVNQKISEIQNKLTNSNLSEGERERLNVELTKNKDRLKNLDKEVPNFGDVQTAMSIVAQSPEMANYMNNNPKEVQDIIKFTKSPNVQESLMDYTLANVYYPIMTSIPDNNKFDKQEQILLLHVMGDTGGKEAIMGKRPIRTGLQMLKDYGFIVNGVNGKPKPNLDINKYNNIVKKLNEISQGEVSLFKLAWKELKGEIPDNISDKELIELNESDGRKDQYGTVNATTTAIGKYQFMWKLHKGIIKKLLEDYEPTAEETEQMDVSLPPEMKGDSISNADRFK